jgi:hypothetical protein
VKAYTAEFRRFLSQFFTEAEIDERENVTVQTLRRLAKDKVKDRMSKKAKAAAEVLCDKIHGVFAASWQDNDSPQAEKTFGVCKPGEISWARRPSGNAPLTCATTVASPSL